jgi:hypothetical protein
MTTLRTLTDPHTDTSSKGMAKTIREWGRALAHSKNPLGDRELGRSLLADARDLQAGLDAAQARLKALADQRLGLDQLTIDEALGRAA